jgi:hypothetical protein
MTEFNDVRRVTRGAYSTLYVKPRKIVVTCAVGDLLVFREHGRRQEFSLPVDTAFKQAIRIKANADARAKQEARKARRASR